MQILAETCFGNVSNKGDISGGKIYCSILSTPARVKIGDFLNKMIECEV
jgi:hypothetical protein